LLKEASELDENSLKAALQLIDSQHTIFLLVGDFARVRPQLDAAGITTIPLR